MLTEDQMKAAIARTREGQQQAIDEMAKRRADLIAAQVAQWRNVFEHKAEMEAARGFTTINRVTVAEIAMYKLVGDAVHCFEHVVKTAYPWVDRFQADYDACQLKEIRIEWAGLVPPKPYC